MHATNAPLKGKRPGYPTHVGIATGYGTVVHASTYTGDVTETWIGYIDGYMGAKRI